MPFALQSKDYPDIDQLRSRIAAVNPRISLANVYNTLRLLVEFGLIERHKRARSLRTDPPSTPRSFEDVISGSEMERLVGEVGAFLGYRLTGHTLSATANRCVHRGDAARR